MNLNFLPGADAFVNQELGDVSPVITLQLDDVTPLAVLHSVAIAAPSLFPVARQFTHVEVVGKTAHCSEALPSVTLLEVQVNKVVAGNTALLLLLRLGSVNIFTTSVQNEHVIILLALLFASTGCSGHLFLWFLGCHLTFQINKF